MAPSRSQCRETTSEKRCRSSRVPHLTGWMYHADGWVPQSLMEGLTPASADDLPPLGELLVDDPFWQYPAWGLAREGVGHLRVWATATGSEGYLAVVTETGSITSVTESAGQIWADLARRYGPSLVLLEHHPAPGSGEGMETLDLVRAGADASPHWSRVWPTPEENPRHAGLERWMAAYGHQIVGRPASWFDWRDGQLPPHGHPQPVTSGRGEPGRLVRRCR